MSSALIDLPLTHALHTRSDTRVPVHRERHARSNYTVAVDVHVERWRAMIVASACMAHFNGRFRGIESEWTYRVGVPQIDRINVTAIAPHTGPPHVRQFVYNHGGVGRRSRDHHRGGPGVCPGHCPDRVRSLQGVPGKARAQRRSKT